MSEVVVIAILSAQSGLILLFGGWLWHHVNECRDVRVDVATIRASVESIAREIGDHESGIRHRLHQLQNALIRLENRRGDER